MNGSDSDWREADKISREREFEQQVKTKANRIKDLEVSNSYLEKNIDNVLEENFRLRIELNEARLSSITYLPKIPQGWASPNLAGKIRELREAGEKLTEDIAKLRETFKRD